jgi:hypothetical protein
METPTPSLREQGVHALREGNVDGAIDLLARAVMADDQDTDAKAYLGVAYSQKGLHEQAVRVLRSALERQPQNVSHRFNLAVAQERAGDIPGAASEYSRVLQSNPEHAQAKARLQALGPQAQAERASVPRPAPSVTGAPPTVGTPPSGAPWLAGGQVQSPAGQAGPPGTVQCSKCQQWSRPGPSCEWCSAPLRSASAPLPGSTPYPSAGSSGYAGTEAGIVAYQEDRFDVAQAFKDWLQVLVSPQSFFRDQEGRTGLAGPISFLLVYTFLSVLFFLPGLLMRGLVGPVPALLILSLGTVVLWLMGLLTMFVWAGIIHLFCMMFGGQGGYTGTFRAASYASAPWAIVGLVAGLVSAATGPSPTPGFGPGRTGVIVPDQEEPRMLLAQAGGRPGFPGGTGARPMPGNPAGQFSGFPMAQQSPLASLLNLVGLAYYLALLGVGVCHIHRLSTGGAVGVAVLSGVAAVVLFIVFVVVLGVAFAAIAMGMRGVGR